MPHACTRPWLTMATRSHNRSTAYDVRREERTHLPRLRSRSMVCITERATSTSRPAVEEPNAYAAHPFAPYTNKPQKCVLVCSLPNQILL